MESTMKTCIQCGELFQPEHHKGYFNKCDNCSFRPTDEQQRKWEAGFYIIMPDGTELERVRDVPVIHPEPFENEGARS
jgi:hypothetical protein